MKVISGGQTGVDRYALEEAKKAGLETGGTAPKGYYTDNGPDPSLADYGVIDSKVFGYPYRTEENVKNSDGTILYGNTNSPGCKLTKRLCKKHNKLYLENPPSDYALFWLKMNDIQTINVAGNREKNLSKDEQNKIKIKLAYLFNQLKHNENQQFIRKASFKPTQV